MWHNPLQGAGASAGLFLKGLCVIDDVAYFGLSHSMQRSARASAAANGQLAAVHLPTARLLFLRTLGTRGLVNVVSAPHLSVASTYAAIVTLPAHAAHALPLYRELGRTDGASVNEPLLIPNRDVSRDGTVSQSRASGALAAGASDLYQGSQVGTADPQVQPERTAAAGEQAAGGAAAAGEQHQDVERASQSGAAPERSAGIGAVSWASAAELDNTTAVESVLGRDAHAGADRSAGSDSVSGNEASQHVPSQGALPREDPLPTSREDRAQLQQSASPVGRLAGDAEAGLAAQLAAEGASKVGLGDARMGTGQLSWSSGIARMDLSRKGETLKPGETFVPETACLKLGTVAASASFLALRVRH